MSDKGIESFDARDWEQLRKLRAVFLSEEFHEQKDYWSDKRLCELYHATFAERIGWKWDAVLAEFRELKAFKSDRTYTLFDYGCGTGIGSQKILQILGAERISSVCLWDKSKKAMDFCKERLTEFSPQLQIEKLKNMAIPTGDWILCLSHVLNELSEGGLDTLLKIASKATYVLWVEPGTLKVSRRLIEVRERLMSEMDPIAPCTHTARCGLLSEKNASHWCHHFALPPKEVFQSAFWNRFSRELKVDLRSLPTSYLVLAKKGDGTYLSPNKARVIGRPRLYKGNGKFLICDETGVDQIQLLERDHRQLFKEYRRDIFSMKIQRS